MARFQAQVTSGALSAGTNFLFLMASAANGFKLRRVTLGVIAGATTPTSQQLQVGIFRVTAAGTSPTTITANQLDPNSPAAGSVPLSGVTSPTLAATPSWSLAFNTQSALDLPWELLEEWVVTKGTANGLAFQNMANAAPASHLIVASIEWEE